VIAMRATSSGPPSALIVSRHAVVSPSPVTGEQVDIESVGATLTDASA
jgi:hypothetical protein